MAPAQPFNELYTSLATSSRDASRTYETYMIQINYIPADQWPPFVEICH